MNLRRACLRWAWGSALVAGLATGAWAQTPDAQAPAEDEPAAAMAESVWTQQGWASWYGGKRWHGRRTASGERFDRHAFTAAHPSLPLGSRVRVVNVDNGREVLVRINDRGPRGHERVIDLSEAAAGHLGFRRQGKGLVTLALEPPENPR